MKLTPLLLGALALGPVLGIVAGTSIDTTPKQAGLDLVGALDSIPRHELSFLDAGPDDATTPDRYPLVTPRGTVQVEDLWLHGLYRNRHSEPALYELDPEYPAYEYEMPAVEVRPAHVPFETQVAAVPEGERQSTGGAAPLSDLSGEAEVKHIAKSTAGSKIIDVAAVVAEN